MLDGNNFETLVALVEVPDIGYHFQLIVGQRRKINWKMVLVLKLTLVDGLETS